MPHISLRTATITLVALLLLWPVLGWFSLYSQFEQLTSDEESSLPGSMLEQTSGLSLSAPELRLGLVPIPRVEMTNAQLSLDGLEESIDIASATWRARWYSPWIFRWQPDRLLIHQGSTLQPADLATEKTWDDAWQLLGHLNAADYLLANHNAIEFERLNVTLFDAEVDRFVDLTVSGDLRRAGDGALVLQSITDMAGDGWIDHGFFRLHGRWQPTEDLEAEIQISDLDAHLEFASDTLEYGFYQWTVEAEDMNVDPVQRAISADFLLLGTGNQDGTPDAPHLEIGERTAINHLRWQEDDPLWRAESVQHASALNPHDDTISDIRWLIDADQWRLSGDDQVGRTQLTWELNLTDELLHRVRAQVIQSGGRAHSLREWSGDYAEVTISTVSQSHDQLLTGFAEVNSDIDAGTLSFVDAEFTEQRDEQDTLWLYMDADVSPQGLTLSDVSGSLSGDPQTRQATLAEWVDCYDTWSPLLSAIITDCASE